MSGLRLHGVGIAYGEKQVVDAVDVEVPNRSWVALIGPNGAGKTSLLKAVAGLIPYQGVIEIGGVPTGSLSRRALSRRVAFLPQRPVFPEGVEVTDYVAIGRTPYIPYWGVESSADREVVAKVLARLDLEDLADRSIDSLSGGEAQRAVLARALAQEAEILLLDEPTAALDVGHQQQVLELIDQLRLEQGLTVLSALHDLTLAAQYAQRLVLLDAGRVVSQGNAAEVLTREKIGLHYSARVRIVDHDEEGLMVVPVRDRTPDQLAVPDGTEGQR